MATYFKYAERSADSQINWAEIGKNMTDMLREETRIREEKKAAIDAASRDFGIELANAPQGEYKPLNQWALEYGDNASQYMLMQDRLLKQGLLKPKDYVVARQNLMDGTKQAFNLAKEFQATYSEKLERYKKGESQDLELFVNEQAQKFGDFTKSQLYINPTDGSVSVAMKEKQVVNGKEVFVMNKNPNEFTTINALRNKIAGRYDKFDTNKVTDAFAESLGKEVQATQIIGTLSKTGSVTSVQDITSRVDIDPATKKILFKFVDAENQMIDAALANPYDRLSVLTNSKKFAPNGKQYTFTYDEAEWKANPDKILLRNDPAKDQPVPEFTPEQIKDSNEFIRTEARAKYDYVEDIKTTPQAQLQERRPPTSAEIEQGNLRQEAKNFAQNLAFVTTGTPAQINAALNYLGQRSGKLVLRSPQGIIISNADGTNSSEYKFNKDGSIQNPKALGRSLIGGFAAGLPEDMVIREYDRFVGNKPLEMKTSGRSFLEPVKKEKPIDVFNRTITTDINSGNTVSSVVNLSDDSAIRDALNQAFGNKYGLEFESTYVGNNVYIKSADGRKESPEFPVGTPDKNKKALKGIEEWVKKNYLKGATLEEKEAAAEAVLSEIGVSSGTVTGGNVR